jgi:hypothetical protein
MLQLSLTRTNQNKPELCSCGAQSRFGVGSAGGGRKGVAKYC